MTVPVLFDRALERERRRRKPPVLPQDLLGHLSEEVLDRLALVKRSFGRLLVCGPFAEQLVSTLSAPGRWTICQAADVAFDLEQLPLAPDSVDCIVCCFGLETVNDVTGSLIQMRRALKPDGLLLACLFAGETLQELRQAWLMAEEDMRGGASPRVAPFADVRELGSLLQRAGFALPVTDVDRTIVRYADALALMREIKALGFAEPLSERSRRPVTPDLLAAAAAAYGVESSDADGRIRATIDIAWLTGWAPHESQQQPLKPGSARMRLADALKTEEHKLGKE